MGQRQVQQVLHAGNERAYKDLVRYLLDESAIWPGDRPVDRQGG